MVDLRNLVVCVFVGVEIGLNVASLTSSILENEVLEYLKIEIHKLDRLKLKT